MLILLLLVTVTICSAQHTEEPWKYYGAGTPMTKLMSQYYKISEIKVVSVGQDMHYTDDVSVCLYLSNASGVDVFKITKWRKESKSWQDIMKTVNFNPARLFTDIGTYTAPSPFTHAYQEYYKFKNDSNYKMTIYDQEVRNLVQLKFMVKRFHMSPKIVIKQRHEGISYSTLILEKLKQD